jgi:tetratricopeptide (TPR) repeat protein
VPFIRVWPLPTLVRLLVRAGDLLAAKAVLDEGKRLLLPEGLQMFTPITLPLAEAELKLAQQQPEHALSVLEQVVDHLAKTQGHAFMAEALCLRGEALLALGRLDEAHAALQAARAAAETLGARRVRSSILAALAELETKRGEPQAARDLTKEALADITWIAEHISAPELRESFLNTPAARRIRAAEAA